MHDKQTDVHRLTDGARAEASTAAIRDLNDDFRRSLKGGRVMMTPGVEALRVETIRRLFMRVKNFDAFGPDNDPYGEHDFGAFDHDGDKFFWKIEYFDPTLTYGSDNPADPERTRRVLTLMLASEY